MDFNALWAIVEPYVIMLATTVSGGLISSVAVKAFASKMIQRLNANFIIKKVTEGVVAALIGGELNIDITALVGDKLTELVNKITAEIVKRVEEQGIKIDNVAKLTVSTADVIRNLKAASPEQQQRIDLNAEAIRVEAPAKPKEITKIKLTPIVKKEDKTDSGIKMG